MYYSAVAFVALTINCILNWKTLCIIFEKADAQDAKQQVKVRYSHFYASYYADMGAIYCCIS